MPDYFNQMLVNSVVDGSLFIAPVTHKNWEEVVHRACPERSREAWHPSGEVTTTPDASPSRGFRRVVQLSFDLDVPFPVGL